MKRFIYVIALCSVVLTGCQTAPSAQPVTPIEPLPRVSERVLQGTGMLMPEWR